MKVGKVGNSVLLVGRLVGTWLAGAVGVLDGVGDLVDDGDGVGVALGVTVTVEVAGAVGGLTTGWVAPDVGVY